MSPKGAKGASGGSSGGGGSGRRAGERTACGSDTMHWCLGAATYTTLWLGDMGTDDASTVSIAVALYRNKALQLHCIATKHAAALYRITETRR